MRTSHLALVGLIGIALAGCGNNAGERALTGGGLGAGTGAALTAMTGGSIVAGAAIGGAAGAAVGALTDKGDINFGDPIWD